MEKLSLLKTSSLFLLICISALLAGNAGGQGNAIMRAPLGAVAVGRGGAYTAAADNSHALWNPALSAQLKKGQFSFGSEFRSLGRFGTYFGGEFPVKRRSIGISYLFNYRGIPGLDSLRDAEGELLEDGSYGAVSLKGGLSIKLSSRLSMGLSLGWNFDKMPVDYDVQTKKLEYGRSKEFSGVSLMGSLKASDELLLAFGLRDLLFLQDWKLEGEGFMAVIKDTVPLDIVVAASLDKKIRNQNFQFDGDLDVYLLNSFFSVLESPYAHVKLGATWLPLDYLSFRIGVRDLLLAGSLQDIEKYKREATPRYSAGFSFASAKIVKFARTRINYALANSGANAGLDHSVDFVLTF